MRPLFLMLIAIALPLGGCNRNTALGNDREAQIDPAPTPAPVENAAAALDNVSVALIKPETMSTTDLAALGGLTGKCAIRLTEVGHPSFVYRPGDRGVIKLNGKLIPLPAVGKNRFEDSGLSVTLFPNGDTGDAGLPGMNMVLVPPGAEDELGYSGFADCAKGGVG